MQKLSYPCNALMDRRDTGILHQKYGCMFPLADLFFPEFLCVFDIPYQIKLRCYFENRALIQNFDSIPYDSVRPKKFETETSHWIDESCKIYQNQNQLIIIGLTDCFIDNLILVDLNGHIIIKKSQTNIGLPANIDLHNIKPGIYFLNIEINKNQKIFKKIWIQ